MYCNSSNQLLFFFCFFVCLFVFFYVISSLLAGRDLIFSTFAHKQEPRYCTSEYARATVYLY